MQQFVTNLQANLDKNPALANIVVTLNQTADPLDPANNTITMTDPAGGIFAPGGYQWVNNTVPSSGTLSWDQTVGAPIDVDVVHTTNVVLDDVGRTSQGGTLDIGSMADGGVQVFNISVDGNSWLTEIASTSDMGDHSQHQLEIVNLSSIGANGDLIVGDVGSVYGEDYDDNYGYLVWRLP